MGKRKMRSIGFLARIASLLILASAFLGCGKDQGTTTDRCANVTCRSRSSAIPATGSASAAGREASSAEGAAAA
jgi:hypothetical protein